MNRITLVTLTMAASLAVFADDSNLSVDFGKITGRVRRELHSSGFGPQICSCPREYIDDIKSMGFLNSRTHDWALLNSNERVCDNHHIFPLTHLDPKQESSYHFAPTDYLFKRTREETGHGIFFRLGTSIEHSGDKVHFNSLIPDDFDRVAENFAATVRHYNRGWANGHEWNIKYWEIWNEPDGFNNMWCLPDGDDGIGDTPEAKKTDRAARDAKRQELFVKFFVACLKRLKSEFGDSIKVGGPALCWMNEKYFSSILEACRKEGIAPDFISWHHYMENSDDAIDAIAKGRRLCDSFGFKKCELIINEWHYFSYSDYDWQKLRSPDPEIIRKVWTGPRSHNGIDSSCFNLSTLSRFQNSALDQGYYYGCRNTGSWGYMDENKQKYKVYHGLRLFGEFVRKYQIKCAGSCLNPKGPEIMTAMAARADGGKKMALLVSDYRVRTREITVNVSGVPANAVVSARVHDYTHDIAPADFSFENGRLVLRKADEESAAFLVEFEVK